MAIINPPNKCKYSFIQDLNLFQLVSKELIEKYNKLSKTRWVSIFIIINENNILIIFIIREQLNLKKMN